MNVWHLLGLGSLGTLSASRLLNAGEQVRVLPRTPAKVISRTLLRPQQPPLTLTFSCAGQESIERLLISVKGPDTRAALAPWLPRLAPEATVICLQNGMGAIDDAGLPSTLRVIHAVTTDGAWRDADQIRVVAENETLIGDDSTKPPDWLPDLQPFWPGLAWCNDITRARWRKLAVNAVINPLTALYRCKNGELLDNGERQQAMLQLAREVDQLATTLFADWTADTPSRSEAVARTTANNTSSMLADVQAGRETEIHFINGYLLRQAKDTGVTLPAHENIVATLTD